MGFRFRKSIKILPGIRINFGKKSASISIGPQGAKMTVGTKGTRLTAGLPGTGLSYTHYSPNGVKGKANATSAVADRLEQLPVSKPRLKIPPNLPFYHQAWFIIGLFILSPFTGFLLIIPAIYLFLQFRKIVRKYNEELQLQNNNHLDFSCDVSCETLNEGIECYTIQQARDDIRIMQDCLNIIEETEDIKTFFDRHDLALRNASTLEKAIKSGVPIPISKDITKTILDIKYEMRDVMLMRSYSKFLLGLDGLKTPKGKINRLNKYVDLLNEYEDEFENSEVYTNIKTEAKSKVIELAS